MKYVVITPTYNQAPRLQQIHKALFHQTYEPDVGWYLAIDGSNDETLTWVQNMNIPYTYQSRDGRRYNEIVNRAVTNTPGEYIIIIAGDSVPDKDFLKWMDDAAHPDRIVCGLRQNVDDAGKIVAPDYRVNYYPDGFPADRFQAKSKRPWEEMTSNGCVIPRAIWEKLGGFDEHYTGYGSVDHDLFMRAHFELGAEMWWETRAVVNHYDLVDKKDDPGNQERLLSKMANYASQG